MDVLTELAGSLLSFAHQLFGPGICPGDWVFATSAAGALLALSPILGAVLVALIRKFTGNRYTGATLGVFATIGAFTVFVVPWVMSVGISEIYREIRNGGSGGLSSSDRATFGMECPFVGEQAEYLGGQENVFDTLFYPGGNQLQYGFYLGALIGLPALTLLFVMLQARMAFRGGPRWPARFFWIPFVALFALTAPVSANTAMHLWLGFLPITVLGLVPLAIVGAPSWHTLRRSEKPKGAPAALPEPERRADPARQYAPTAVAPPPPVPAAMAAPLPALGQPGSRYKRIRRLGHGGFGTVWEAVDTQLDRTVALKIAHAPDPDTEVRMHREARALAAVDHPNCVRVYDLVEEPDGLALVMEYLEGRALAFAVDESGPVDDIAAARLWSTMAGALLAAHEKGVLHRDVKPSNVIVDAHGMPHLIDFGIARSKGDATMTAAGMMIGTPDYTAPETANGAAATPASDAWQLAATVSFALTGKPPRGVRETPMAALLAAARAEALTELPRRSVHSGLLAAALDTEPKNRPTLTAVIGEMNAWLAGAGAPAEGPVTRMLPKQ